VDAQRRSALLATKLAALVRTHLGPEADDEQGRPSPYPGGAALARAGEAWVLVEDDPGRALGGAMAWGRQQGLEQVHVLVEDTAAAGTVARRATAFGAPTPQVWLVEGRELVPAVPAPLPTPAALAPEVAALATLIRAGGAEPVAEHGQLVGEVDGLEVCRAVVGDDGVAALEVGVGRHDREAFGLLHGHVPTVEALAGVVARVRAHREGDEPHPLRRLAGERRLRNRVVADPASVGASELVPVPPPVPSPGLKQAAPAVAAGVDAEGRPLVVVCSVGVDLELVPWASDARRADGRGPSRLLLALPQRDVHPVTVALAARLREPAEVVGIDVAAG
jgi:hypothetical protein